MALEGAALSAPEARVACNRRLSDKHGSDGALPSNLGV